jgi:hypothetical protein
VFLACSYTKKGLQENQMGTLMNQNFNKTKMPQAIDPKDQFHQMTMGLTIAATPTKRHISYNKREDHILDYEKKLMKRFKCGYSGLHKMLVLKEAQQQFSTPYL